MTSLAFHVDQLYYPVPGGIGTYVRRLIPAMTAADPELRVTLFHARFRDRGAGPPERWMGAFATVGLPQAIRTLYPSWAVAGRPALPPGLASHHLLHAPSPSAVPPAGTRQRQ